MKTNFFKHALVLLFAAGLIVSPLGAFARLDARSGARSGGGDETEVKTRGVFNVDKAQKGKTIQAAVVMEIPDGYHVNSARPLGRYAIATVLKIEGPRGLRTGVVSYPRGTAKTFSFFAGTTLGLRGSCCLTI